MSDPFGVQPELKKVAADLSDVAAKMTAIWQHLSEGIDTEGNVDNPGQPPWGNQGDGVAFAGGVDGFLAQFASFGVAMKAKVALLLSYAAVLDQTADRAQAQDSA